MGKSQRLLFYYRLLLWSWYKIWLQKVKIVVKLFKTCMKLDKHSIEQTFTECLSTVCS